MQIDKDELIAWLEYMIGQRKGGCSIYRAEAGVLQTVVDELKKHQPIPKPRPENG